jgi:hypothetical protein
VNSWLSPDSESNEKNCVADPTAVLKKAEFRRTPCTLDVLDEGFLQEQSRRAALQWNLHHAGHVCRIFRVGSGQVKNLRAVWIQAWQGDVATVDQHLGRGSINGLAEKLKGSVAI